MGKIIDISVTLQEDLPTWPGSPQFELVKTMSLEHGDDANVSMLQMDVHTGTHIDAPSHFIQGGSTVESLDLDYLLGPAFVVDLNHVNSITATDLESLKLPPETCRLLFRTRNSRFWQEGVTEFQEDFVALTVEAARWVVEHNIKLVGIDYLSIQRFGDSPLTHQILLEAGVIIVEGLNLTQVTTGLYNFICLPLKLGGAEGAPARAVLTN